jgi:hypothetical protein
MDFASHMPNGCIDQVQQCREAYLHDKQKLVARGFFLLVVYFES